MLLNRICVQHAWSDLLQATLHGHCRTQCQCQASKAEAGSHVVKWCCWYALSYRSTIGEIRFYRPPRGCKGCEKNNCQLPYRTVRSGCSFAGTAGALFIALWCAKVQVQHTDVTAAKPYKPSRGMWKAHSWSLFEQHHKPEEENSLLSVMVDVGVRKLLGTLLSGAKIHSKRWWFCEQLL